MEKETSELESTTMQPASEKIQTDDWPSPADPENLLNWTTGKKIYHTAIPSVAFVVFVLSPMNHRINPQLTIYLQHPSIFNLHPRPPQDPTPLPSLHHHLSLPLLFLRPRPSTRPRPRSAPKRNLLTSRDVYPIYSPLRTLHSRLRLLSEHRSLYCLPVFCGCVWESSVECRWGDYC